MKAYLVITIFVFVCISTIFAQVGIGTSTPDNSAMLEVASNSKGILFPRLTTLQRNAISAPASGLHVFDLTTNSLWFYNGAYWINYATQSKNGDIKSGIQSTDHEGWIKLDGRLLTSLSSSQQVVATSLGLSGTLPNASNSYLSQNGGTLGTVSGANTVTLTQSNLPNVNFTGTAANAGGHSHTTDPAAFNSANAGNHDHWVDPPSTLSSTDGWHNHGSNANGANIGLALINGWGTPSGIDNSWNEINNYATPALDIYGAGNHNHWTDISGFASSINGNHTHSIDVPSTASSTVPDHSHSVTISSGGSANPINIAPKSLTVNMFIYLGY